MVVAAARRAPFQITVGILFIMRIFILAALVAVAGCAAQPEVSDTKSPAASAPPLAPATSSESTARAAEAKPVEFKPPNGYKKRVAGQATIYCAKVVVLGSRFAKEDCRTQAELEDLALQRESMRGEIEQRRRICASAAGCANP
jgi:hypothetical protein